MDLGEGSGARFCDFFGVSKGLGCWVFVLLLWFCDAFVVAE